MLVDTLSVFNLAPLPKASCLRLIATFVVAFAFAITQGTFPDCKRLLLTSQAENIRYEDANHFPMQIFVKLLTGKTATFIANPEDTIWDVKLKIAEREGIPARVQRLIFSGETTDNRTLSSYGIQECSRLDLLIRLGRDMEAPEGMNKWSSWLTNHPVLLDDLVIGSPCPPPTFTLEFRSDFHDLEQTLFGAWGDPNQLRASEIMGRFQKFIEFTDQTPTASRLQLLKLSPYFAALPNDAALKAELDEPLRSLSEANCQNYLHAWKLFTEQMPLRTDVRIVQRGSIADETNLTLTQEEYYTNLARREAAGTRWRVECKVQEELTPGGVYALYLHRSLDYGKITQPLVLPFRVSSAIDKLVQKVGRASLQLEMDMYNNAANAMFTAKNQERNPTCYAHAAAAVMHMAMLRVFNRRGGVPDFQAIRDHILREFPPNGSGPGTGHVTKNVMTRVAPASTDCVAVKRTFPSSRPGRRWSKIALPSLRSR